MFCVLYVIVATLVISLCDAGVPLRHTGTNESVTITVYNSLAWETPAAEEWLTGTNNDCLYSCFPVTHALSRLQVGSIVDNDEC